LKPAGAVDGRIRRRRWRRLAVVTVLAGLAGLYPAFVIGATYMHFFRAGLPGGRHGPADAYRHALASAIVGYTLSPRCVDWVTAVMERGGEGNASRAMDAHNNRLGARIGAGARSWTEMQTSVREAVQRGTVQTTDADRITWLPQARWQERLY
jgi:hypothetical protein